MINTQTKTDTFRDRIKREVETAKEDGRMKDWELYEHLKGFIPAYKINYIEAIKIITEVADL